MPEETKTELALRIGGAVVCQTMLGDFQKEESQTGGIPVLKSGAGFNATLDFMVKTLANHPQPLLESLLTVLPVISAYSEFLSKLPKFELTEKQFEYLMELGHIL